MLLKLEAVTPVSWEGCGSVGPKCRLRGFLVSTETKPDLTVGRRRQVAVGVNSGAPAPTRVTTGYWLGWGHMTPSQGAGSVGHPGVQGALPGRSCCCRLGEAPRTKAGPGLRGDWVPSGAGGSSPSLPLHTLIQGFT